MLMICSQHVCYACRANHLGSVGLLHPRFDPRSLHPYFSHTIFPHSLLCDPWLQQRLLRQRCPGCAPHLSTNILQLGSQHSRWSMRRSEVSGSVRWRIQSLHGRCSRGFTNACTLGIADGPKQEGDVEWDVWTGHNVRLPWNNPVHQRPIVLTTIRICIITIVRIKITFDINGSNLKSSYSLLKLLADLEALLGVINACFPVMKPVFTKLAASNASNWLSSVMSGSIPMFIRPLKLGSNGKAAPSKAFAKGWSSSKQPIPKEMDRWSPNSSNSTPPISNLGQPPPPRCMDITPTDLVRPEPLRVSSRNSALRSPRPPVPDYSPARQREPAPMGDAAGFGIHVQNEWDIERGESHETDRDLLEDQR